MDVLVVHIEKEHWSKENDNPEKQKGAVRGERGCFQDCPLCEDKFRTDEEFNIHINEHLAEIKSIDIEYLKRGHEVFACMQILQILHAVFATLSQIIQN